nr:competence protein CoiA family protein [Microvirga splendida]
MTAGEHSKSSETDTSPLNGFGCRNGQPSLVFGQRPDGSIAHISEVPRGKECGCVCPGCGSPLVARQGQVLDHHFGHLATSDGRPCRTGPETALHMFAKELLARELRLTLPPVHFDDGVETWSKFPGGNYTFDSAILENKLGDIIPDVVVTREGLDLIVEFVVTHECGPDKIAKIQELDVAGVEIYLADLSAGASKEEVEKGILDTCQRKWLHNPLVREGEAALDTLRIEQDREMLEPASSLRQVYLQGAAELKSLTARSPEYRKAISLGLRGYVGIRVAGLGCFTVLPDDWQATYLLAMAPKPNERGASLTIQDILRDMIQRGWIRPEFRWLNPDLVSPDLVNAIKVGLPEFAAPFDAVSAWLQELHSHDWLTSSMSDDEWSTEDAWSMTDHGNRVILRALSQKGTA